MQKRKIYITKIVSMIRKYHNHKLLSNPLHREEESHNNHETLGRLRTLNTPCHNRSNNTEQQQNHYLREDHSIVLLYYIRIKETLKNATRGDRKPATKSLLISSAAPALLHMCFRMGKFAGRGTRLPLYSLKPQAGLFWAVG